jgi:hypothetical protein
LRSPRRVLLQITTMPPDGKLLPLDGAAPRNP